MSESWPQPRLLVLASTFPRWEGDPEPAFVHQLALRLTDKFEVSVICPHSRGALVSEQVDGVRVRRFRYAPERLETLVNDGGIVTNIRKSPWKLALLPGYALAMIWAIRREIAARRPSVVHAHWIIPQGLLYLLGSIGKRSPLVVTSHGADLFALRGQVFERIRRYVCSHAELVTVVSPVMRERLVAEHVPRSKVKVASMGVDFQQLFTPDPSIPRSPSELLFVGRLVEKKGVRVLIEAMPMILRECPDTTLTIAGFGPEETSLREQVRALGLSSCVSFLGAVEQSQLPALYRRASLFVAPFIAAASGDQEGLGLVTLEASGCGCPVVVCDIPAVREVFEERVECGNPMALGAAVINQLRASQASRAEVAESQRLRLAHKYDWTSVAREYGRLLDSVVRSEHATP